MERKKWTPKTEITDALIKFREKRKWQLAFRRYVLEKKISADYAFYFGLGIDEFRQWIEIQFSEGLNWGNFGAAWQFEHIIPVTYFDFSDEHDLKLCWNFINIQVEKLEPEKTGNTRINLIAVKPYFESLYKKTGYVYCIEMIEKINKIEAININNVRAIEEFITKNKHYLETVSTLNKDEFTRLNKGVGLTDLLKERELMKKFG